MELRQGLVESAERYQHAVRVGDDLNSRRERLADAIRALVLARLARLVDASLADDLAQIAAPRVLEAFARGCTTAERLPAYADEAARNAFRDHRRRAVTKRESPTEPAELPAVDSGAPSPEEAVADAQEERALITRVRALVAQAPAAYREVLTRHYLEERPIHELVEDEVTARLERDGRDHTAAHERTKLRSSARQTVDQRLCRARLWMQKQLSDGVGRVRSASAAASCE